MTNWPWDACETCDAHIEAGRGHHTSSGFLCQPCWEAEEGISRPTSAAEWFGALFIAATILLALW